MKKKLRLVIDTNIFVSHLLLKESIPGQAINKGIQNDIILLSDDIVAELTEVLMRNKFDKYLPMYDRLAYLYKLIQESVVVEITENFTHCIDPKDNKFLDLAVCGNADYIISGDKKHLQSIGNFHGIQIISPRKYLDI